MSHTQAKALYNYDAKSPQELTVKAGTVLSVITKHPSGWWIVEVNGAKGAIPGSYCQEIPIEEKEESTKPIAKQEPEASPFKKGISPSSTFNNAIDSLIRGNILSLCLIPSYCQHKADIFN